MLGPTDLMRDAADLAITRAAVEANVPTLATCRGIQVLNVAMGGTLVQHIDDHMRVDMYNEDVHAIDIDPTSRLATILGTDALGVNSMHHQVIDDLGRGVRAVAHNHDGHIEAIEIDAAPAVLGVQWHPEMLRHRSDHLALFEDLVRQVVGADTASRDSSRLRFNGFDFGTSSTQFAPNQSPRARCEHPEYPNRARPSRRWQRASVQVGVGDEPCGDMGVAHHVAHRQGHPAPQRQQDVAGGRRGWRNHPWSARGSR